MVVIYKANHIVEMTDFTSTRMRFDKQYPCSIWSNDRHSFDDAGDEPNEQFPVVVAVIWWIAVSYTSRTVH